MAESDSQNQSSVLVTGGAGYIGSHTVRQLVDAGKRVVIVDNLYSGHRWAVADEATFYQGNAGDRSLIQQVIEKHNVTAVVHFAGHIVVPESVVNPDKYYQNNAIASARLIQTCVENGVANFVFSSSAAVYGIPPERLANENHVTAPINPYGRSKLITEWTLEDQAHAAKISDGKRDFRYTALRYFNVAGAHDGGKLGQATPEATHLIKIACEAACGVRDSMTIYGSDYPTADGTCVRDYIHVEDLANAHLLALEYLDGGGSSQIMNCGYGHGFSVTEVVAAVKQVSGVDFTVQRGDRRAGDPPELIANNEKIQSLLGWQPKRDDLALICRSAYEWELHYQTMRQDGSAA